MLGWLYRILVGRFGCAHKWVTVHSVQTYDISWCKKGEKGLPYVEYVQVCEKCGTERRLRRQGYVVK